MKVLSARKRCGKFKKAPRNFMKVFAVLLAAMLVLNAEALPSKAVLRVSSDTFSGLHYVLTCFCGAATRTRV